ncbi:MAG: chemotaxis-specific protein-glutamate methyltransferase CheB [Lachnospiraceae bacterium]|nr:chemotaxis-specific protein-glutamate methyltransferase CheB [Lachnospiraceae bacterium]
MKNILVVDDSALMRRVICDIINTDELFRANDVCRDGLEAYEKLKIANYDAVILDVNMPKMNGLELLEKLHEEKIKATVIMVSTLTTKDATTTIMAMERGAVDFVPKPMNIIEARGEEFKNHLLNVLRAVLSCNQEKRNIRASEKYASPSINHHVAPKNIPGNKLVALACSTGGPKALQSVIPYLPANMKAPVVLVQHMPKGFTKTMAQRLNEISEVIVKEAEDGDTLRSGIVYIAPGGRHMLVRKTPTGHKIVLSDEAAIGGLKPCANLTYQSLKDCDYNQIICVVLTGMGADGTKGILELGKHRPIHTIAQNEETCVVYGMPKSIVDSKVADEIVPLNEIAQAIIKNVGVK